ncbi:nucleotidyltransferase domain-containing protein [Paenibacillus antibioticophila]|uniref:nucleotidyltransferase domain-containing protein n=1 Tax=Paenibacillus antibioticophila TaxID=1274374 RepID=UPI0005CB26C6|nr:nucleotidyltransferase domain-containing protein [Paenibacillus antibioticophila]
MLNELQSVHNAFITAMKAEQGVLGAWYFGSAAHGTTDDHSDIDIVFLVEEAAYTAVDEKLTVMLGGVCDEVILCWPEDFNSQAIKNYGYILRQKEHLFQYDVFLLNKARINEEICRIHYTELQAKDIVFDRDGSVQALADLGVKGHLWKDDIRRLITTYWFHVQMSAKYFARQDFFKLNGVLRILMDTHSSLLLTAYDQITWGGSASKLHYIDETKQKHLMKYGCTEDLVMVRDNLLQAMEWFEDDVREFAVLDESILSPRAIELIKQDWTIKTGSIVNL